jgi:hypothetical protein
MRRLRILVQGSNPPVFKLKIGPTTRTRDVLAHLKLDERYALYPVSDPQKHFSMEDTLYDHVKNGCVPPFTRGVMRSCSGSRVEAACPGSPLSAILFVTYPRASLS